MDSRKVTDAFGFKASVTYEECGTLGVKKVLHKDVSFLRREDFWQFYQVAKRLSRVLYMFRYLN